MDKKILKYAIILNPLLDIIYSIMSRTSINLPINQGLRILFMMYLFFKFTNNKDKLFIVFIGILFGIGEVTYLYSNGTSLFNDLQYVNKILYFIIVVYAFRNILSQNILTLNQLLNYLLASSCIITMSIVLSVFGIGFHTYFDARFGYKGFFTVQNAITATLVITTPINIFMYTRFKCKKYLVSFILSVLSLCLIGTKAGIVGGLLNILLVYLIFLFKMKLTYIKVILSCFSIVAIVAFAYFKQDLFVNAYNITIEKIYSWGEDNIYSYVVSNRNLQLEYIKQYIDTYYKQNPLLFFGMGFSSCNNILKLHSFDIIEMDFSGILYYSGVWISIVIFSIIAKRILLSIKYLFKSKFSIQYFTLLLSIVGGTIHAFLGGHVIYEAMTVLYYGIALTIPASLYKDIKNKETTDDKEARLTAEVA